MCRLHAGDNYSLQHVNELSCKLDVDSLISRAESIYRQIEGAKDVPDQIKIVLGLPVLENTTKESPNTNSFTYVDDPVSNEENYERAISNSFL